MSTNLIKLAVGVENVDHLRRIQEARLQAHGRVFHLTRAVPTRAGALLDGGSIYWVMKGVISARQCLVAVEDYRDDDGGRRCRLILDATLIEVERRPHKPFQGWRYLEAAAAPPDRIAGAEEPPPEMAAELRRLGLL